MDCMWALGRRRAKDGKIFMPETWDFEGRARRLGNKFLQEKNTFARNREAIKENGRM